MIIGLIGKSRKRGISHKSPISKTKRRKVSRREADLLNVSLERQYYCSGHLESSLCCATSDRVVGSHDHDFDIAG